MRKLCLMLSAIFLLLLNTMAQTRTVTGKVTFSPGLNFRGKVANTINGFLT